MDFDSHLRTLLTRGTLFACLTTAILALSMPVASAVDWGLWVIAWYVVVDLGADGLQFAYRRFRAHFRRE